MGVSIVLGIPGPWASLAELDDALAATEWQREGALLRSRSTEEELTLELRNPDPLLARAFDYAGQGAIDPALLGRIAEHRGCVYLVTEDQSLGGVIRCISGAAAVIEAGGIAVKVESAGVAHAVPVWHKLTEGQTPNGLATAFVCLVGRNPGASTCGMHNFGLPDICVPVPIEGVPLGRLLSLLILYQFARPEIICDGDSLQLAGTEQPLRFWHTVYEGYPERSVHANPYGMVLVERADQPKLWGTNPDEARYLRALRSNDMQVRVQSLSSLALWCNQRRAALELQGESREFLSLPVYRTLLNCLFDPSEEIRFLVVNELQSVPFLCSALAQELTDLLPESNMILAMAVMEALKLAGTTALAPLEELRRSPHAAARNPLVPLWVESVLDALTGAPQ